jgi:hypothetical protein
MTVDEKRKQIDGMIGNLWRCHLWCQVNTKAGPSSIFKIEQGDWIMCLGGYDGTTGCVEYLHLGTNMIIFAAEARVGHFFSPDYVVFREPEEDFIDSEV